MQQPRGEIYIKLCTTKTYLNLCKTYFYVGDYF